jgi:hypothetical protein
MISGHEIGTEACPLEIKGYSFAADKINHWRDFLSQPQHWLQQVPCQLQMYLYAHAAERGYLIIYEKISGLLKPIEVELDLDFTEALLSRCEAVYAAREAGEPPARCEYDRDLCRGCDWEHICQPFLPIDRQGFIHNPEMVEACRTYLILREDAAVCGKAEALIKATAKEDVPPEYETVFVGDVAELHIKRGSNVRTTILPRTIKEDQQ